MHRFRQLARHTPASRERYVDLLRAIAIITVITGHWLMTVIQPLPSGGLVGRNALQDLVDLRAVTWLFQVLPLFFLVGGYANAASLTNRLARDGDRAGWLADRSARLLGPTTLFLVIAATVSLIAWLAGVDPRQIRLAVWFVTVPLWFLAPYLLVVLLTPVMFALHQRAGFAVPLVLLGLVGLGDAARLLDLHWWGAGNYVFGWLLMHQLGFAWRTGTLRSRPPAATALLLAGLIALLLLTVPGPYPVGMINLPGQRLQNMSPPSLALISLAIAQLGLVLLLRGPAERMLRRAGPWTAVVAVNAVVLTIFLWHLTAVTLLAGAMNALGVLPTPPAGSTEWWLWRVPWVVLAAVLLTPLVLLFGPVEARAGRRLGRRLLRPPPHLRGLLVVLGYLTAIGGLLGNSNYPRDRVAPLGIPIGALAAYLAGAGLLRLLRGGNPRPGP
ncbi:acyltransferase [Plantactinospora sp. GCM10030261]|uniref:acyltransferase family protein n=1 Tax=Plantactinospora sp. GCM10030261 TaxID=3273420 RepID=UPI003620AD28